MRGPNLRLGAASLIFWVALTWCGCSGTGTGRVDVLQPYKGIGRYTSALVTEEGSLESVPGEVREGFRLALGTYLFEKYPFNRGPELRIVYAITGYHRAMGEGGTEGKDGSARGSITAEVRFLNFVGKEIGSIRSTWDTGESGTLDKAVGECARQVASYAKRKFWDVGIGLD